MKDSHSTISSSVSFSPLQGYGQTHSFKKYSTDYNYYPYVDQKEGPGMKSSLPNDSWHYQMQLQKTIHNADNLNKTLELDLDTFKTEK